MRGGELLLAKTAAPLRFVWTWPDADVATLDPTMVVVSREPDDRWYVTFAVDTDAPAPLEKTGHTIGMDLGVKDFAVTSDGERIANPRHLERKARSLARYQRRMARCRKGLREPGQGQGEGRPRPPEGPQRKAGLPAPRQYPASPLRRRDRD
jgi:putative transposase